MSDTTAYLLFLVLGVLLVIVDGQIVLRAGQPYLADMYRSESAAAAANRLTGALFHLVVLGLLALLSAVSLGGNGIMQVVEKLGFLLLVLAAVHGGTMAIYSWLRGRQRELTLTDDLASEHHTAAYGYGTHTPYDVPTQRPTVAPNLDQVNP